MTNIRIIATPAGEAPEEIRKAWIGIVLPLRQGMERPVSHNVLGGVLTMPKNILAYLFKKWFTNPPKRMSYFVTSKVAIELLAQYNPKAAQWWFDNVPHLAKSSRLLLGFEPEVCEIVPEELLHSTLYKE